MLALSKAAVAVVLVLAGAVFSCPAARAAVDVLVFDFIAEPEFPEPWAGPALTDFSIRLLNSSGKMTAMPREDLRRLINRWPRQSRGVISFDQQESLRKHAGAVAIVEGRLSYRQGAVSFTGTYMEPEKNVIEDLSFAEKSFNIESLRNSLKQKLEKAAKIQNLNGGAGKRPAGTSNEKAYTAFWKSVSLYEKGEPARALPLAEEASKADAAYIEPRLLIGRILLEKTDLNGAAAEFRKVTAAAPDDPRGHFWLGFANQLLRRNADAENSLRKAIQLAPGNPDYLYQLGMLLKSLTKYSEAAKMFERACAADESISDAWYQLAAIHSIMRKEPETLDYLSRAVKWGGRDIAVRAGNDADFEWLRDLPKFHIILKSYLR